MLRALGLGDLLTAVPALRAIRESFPDHRVLLATHPALAPLVSLTGAVDEILPVEGLGPLAWNRPAPDVAINLHGRGPQSHRIVAALGPSRLIAFHHPAVDGSEASPRWRPDEHEAQRWCRLLSESGIPADPSRLDLELERPDGEGEPVPTAVVHPGAGDPARRWFPERWATVARALADDGWQVVVTGSASEVALATAVAEGAGLPRDAVLAGGTGVGALATVVATAGLVCCGDTGVAHLATALRTPSVVLFGPVPPSEWGPPPDRPCHVALWHGRRGDPHGTSIDPGLSSITAEEVLAAARRATAASSIGVRVAPSAGDRCTATEKGRRGSPVSVVIITRDRPAELATTLGHLTALEPEPPVIVVDNGSAGGVPADVRRRFPQVEVVEAGENLASAGRNVGVERAGTPYVAFSDDDSWWSPGALPSAAAILDRHPSVALVAGRTLVGADQHPDPLNDVLAAGPPAADGLDGWLVLGFLACAAVVRRSAFLQVGGFERRLGVGGEESLLALDLAAAGWDLLHCPDVVAHHHPSSQRDPCGRSRQLVRNALWVAWRRLPAAMAAACTGRELRRALRSPARLAGVADAVGGAAWVWRSRSVVPEPVAELCRQLP